MTQSEEHICFIPGDTFLYTIDSKGSTRSAASFTSGAADGVAMLSYRSPPAVANYSFTIGASGGATSTWGDG